MFNKNITCVTLFLMYMTASVYVGCEDSIFIITALRVTHSLCKLKLIWSDIFLYFVIQQTLSFGIV